MHPLDRDLALENVEPLHRRAPVTDEWSINGNPNGGYLMALLTAALLKVSGKCSTPVITANYVSRCVPGAADILVEEISSSGQFSRYSARLLQEGREKIRLLGTFAAAPLECPVERYESTAPPAAPPDACISLPALPRYTLYDRLDLRLDPVCAGWLQGRLSDVSEQRGWVSFREERSHDLLSLLLMADAFPPPVLASQGLTAWVPTLELSVNIRNYPQGNWIMGLFRTRFITCGLLESDGELWDGEGNLLGISRQIAQYRKSG